MTLLSTQAYMGTGGGGGGGGGGLHFNRPPNIFTGADIAAARTARDTYFGTAAGIAVLPAFQGDQSLAIILRVTGSTDSTFEAYLPGQRGNPYDSAQWVERTDAVQGNAGPQGRFPVYEYVSLGAAPTIAGGGSFNLDTGIQTPTAGTSIAPTRPTAGQDVYVREAYVDDKTDAGLVDLSARWSVWVERAHLSGGISHVEHSVEFGGTGLLVDPLTLDDAITRDTEIAQLLSDITVSGLELTIARQDGGTDTRTVGGITQVEHSADFSGTGLLADPLILDDAITRDTEIAQLISNLTAVGFVITITRQDGSSDTLDIPDDLVDVTDTGLPVLTADNYKKLFANHDTPRVWVGRRRYTSRTPATGNFIDYTASNYEGEHTSGSEPAPLHHGNRYYNVSRHVWRRVITNPFGFNTWSDVAWASLFSSGAWLGEELDDATAVNLISGFVSTATWMYYNRTSFSVEILDPTSYVAPVDPVPVFVAEPISAPTGVGSVSGVTAGVGMTGGGLSGVVSLSIDITKADFPIIPIDKGGTGAATAAAARTALGITDSGITFRYGANAPLPDVGEVGDPHLRTSNGSWYVKTAQGWGSPVYTDRVGSGGGGQDEAQVNVLIATAFGDAFTNNTESRITATYNSDGTVDLVVSAPNFLSGSGVPDDANDGANGDLYLQTNGAWYQKANDLWGAAIYTPPSAGQRGASVQFIYRNGSVVPAPGATDITVDANGIINVAPPGWSLNPSTAPAGQRTYAQEITVSGAGDITYGSVGAWSGELGSVGPRGSSVQFIYTNAPTFPTFVNAGVTADSDGILNAAPSPWSLSPTVPPAGSSTYVQQIRVTGAGGIIYSRPTSWSGVHGINGISVYVGYSVDGATLWHATLAAADRYIRTVRAAARPGEASNTWSTAIRFVGTDGNRGISLQYIYQNAVAAPAAIAAGVSALNGEIVAYPADWRAIPEPPPAGQRTWAQSIYIGATDTAISYGGVTAFTGGPGDGTIAWQDEGVARAGVATVNLVGEGVVAEVAGGVLTVTIAGGGTPPPSTHTRYAAIRENDNVFVAADFTGVNGTSSASDEITLPVWQTGNRYLAFAQPASLTAYSDMRQQGSPFNVRASFAIAASTEIIVGEAHRIYIFDSRLLISSSGDIWELS